MSKNEKRELEKTVELTDKGRFEEAIAQLEVLQTSADPEVHDTALNYLADAYESLSRHAEAEAMLRRSIEERGQSNPGLGDQLAVLAPVVRRQSRDDEAEEIYRRALEALKTDDAELRVITMRNLAYLYWSTDRVDEARELLGSLPDCDEGFLGFLTDLLKAYIEPEVPV